MMSQPKTALAISSVTMGVPQHSVVGIDHVSI
jgi:hypothetical protein